MLLFFWLKCSTMKNKTVGHPDSGRADTADERKWNPYPPFCRSRAEPRPLPPPPRRPFQRPAVTRRGGGMGVDGKTDMPLDNRASTGCPSLISNAPMHSLFRQPGTSSSSVSQAVGEVAKFVEEVVCSDANDDLESGRTNERQALRLHFP